MNYSNILDLNLFFYSFTSEKYVIVKKSNIPDYYSGSDVDIFCLNLSALAKKILIIGNSYLDKEFEISVQSKKNTHINIDFILNGNIEFRFDLYGELPQYKRINIKRTFFKNVIYNAIPVNILTNNYNYNIFVPSQIDELIIRYIEYIEYYEIRPDKIKHLQYIMDTISNDLEKRLFLDQLHQFTALPLPKENNYLSVLSRKISNLQSFINVLKIIGK